MDIRAIQGLRVLPGTYDLYVWSLHAWICFLRQVHTCFNKTKMQMKIIVVFFNIKPIKYRQEKYKMFDPYRVPISWCWWSYCKRQWMKVMICWHSRESISWCRWSYCVKQATFISFQLLVSGFGNNGCRCYQGMRRHAQPIKHVINFCECSR